VEEVEDETARGHHATRTGAAVEDVVATEEDAEAVMDMVGHAHGQGRGAGHRAAVLRELHTADPSQGRHHQGEEVADARHHRGEADVVEEAVEVEEVADEAQVMTPMEVGARESAVGAETVDEPVHQA
jgi:hypothetical protein